MSGFSKVEMSGFPFQSVRLGSLRRSPFRPAIDQRRLRREIRLEPDGAVVFTKALRRRGAILFLLPYQQSFERS
jgi:hypothetical protein